MDSMDSSPSGPVSFLAFLAAAVAGLAVVSSHRSSTEADAPRPLQRSPQLELPREAAALAEVTPELGWVVPPVRTGWGEVAVPAAPPELAGLAARGQELGRELCASCHGPGGRGDGELAESLVRRPRDLTGELRTRSVQRGVAGEDVFRTLTVGAPDHGMPAFGHLPAEERWALVAWVLGLQTPAQASTRPMRLPERPQGAPDLHLGQDVYRAQCATCHGQDADGRGPLAAALVDGRGDPCPPTAFTSGPQALRGGARAEDIARTLLLGRGGTPMAAFDLPPEQLWAVSSYVAELTRIGLGVRRAAWNEYFTAQRPALPEGSIVEDPRRFSERRSKRYAVAPEGSPAGCLGCHQGIEHIAEGAMSTALAAFAGGDPARECAVCHEGDPRARAKAEAHAGMIGNPGSLWVTSVGAGCAKCHSSAGSLTTLMGDPLPEPVGGRLMHAISHRTDPSGATSGDYTYRMQRGLMAQETGKVLLVTSSVGFVSPDEPKYSDFPLTDPDGPTPCVGSDAYQDWIARALSSGYLQRLAQTKGVPTFQEAVELGGGDRALASVVDYGRKACFRCHLWGEGKPVRLEHRSSGCSACHVVWGERAHYEGDDPTLPRRKSGHAMRHELVMTPPDETCNRCHTRNPLTEGTEPHQLAGLGCVDCHTSVDVHGDGNAYPNMEHQVEVRCQDCHGEGSAAPWELPLGHSTPVRLESPRGVFTKDGREHLLSNRGNPRTNWVREGDQVVIESFLTGARHVVPPLWTARAPKGMDDSGCGRLAPGHEELSCSLCHNRKAARCNDCHMTYSEDQFDQDWLFSALTYGAGTGRQRNVFTPGKVEFEASDPQGVPFGAPDARRDRANRWVPYEHGCRLTADHMDADGRITRFVPKFNPGSPSFPPIVANTNPHENAIPPRSCKECHVQGLGEGAPVILPGDPQPDRGDWWRDAPEGDPSQAAKSRWKR